MFPIKWPILTWSSSIINTAVASISCRVSSTIAGGMEQIGAGHLCCSSLEESQVSTRGTPHSPVSSTASQASIRMLLADTNHQKRSNGLLVFTLKYIEVVCGSNCNNILLWVPCSMQDFFVEVQAINTDFIFLSLASCAHFPWLQHSPWFHVVSTCLQRHILLLLPVKHPEEIVVGPSHDVSVTKTHLNNTNYSLILIF